MHQETGLFLVTGTSTGIGNHLILRLGDLGHRVFSTVRKTADLERLAGITGVEPIAMLRARAAER